MAHDGVLYDVVAAELDAMSPAVAGCCSDLDATLLTLKTLLSFIVRPDLVAAHPPHQPLPLADGKRLQQTLVYLHILTKDITELETTCGGRDNNGYYCQPADEFLHSSPLSSADTLVYRCSPAV